MFKKTTILIIITTLVFSCFLLITHIVQAEQTLQTEYPEILGEKIDKDADVFSFIRYIYVFMLGLIGIAATGALVFGGIMYMTSGTITTTEEAKKWFIGAIVGLILALSAYLILNTINPDLVDLKIGDVQPVQPEFSYNSLCQNEAGACRSSCPNDWTESGTCESGDKCCLPPSSHSF